MPRCFSPWYVARALRPAAQGLLTGLPALLVLVLIAAITARQQPRTSNRRHTEAEARRIAAVADSVRFADPVRAMQLSAPGGWPQRVTAAPAAARVGQAREPGQQVGEFVGTGRITARELVQPSGDG
jgi:hypothetical protein